MASYQGTLTDRSRTVSATWARGGNSAMSIPFAVDRLRFSVNAGTEHLPMTEAPPQIAATPGLLESALEQLRLEGAIFFRSELTEPFAFESVPLQLADALHP